MPAVTSPDSPDDLSAGSWKGVLRRTVTSFRERNLTDWAAALTYYAVLALFPALLVLVSFIGLAGQHPDTTNALLGIVEDLGPSSAVETFRGPIEEVVESKGGAGALLGVGLLSALWSASGYIGAFMRASNAIYEIEEGRPFWKLRPLQVLVTLAMVLALAVVALALVISGPVAEAVGKAIGLGGAAVTAWGIAKWPVLLVIVMTMVAVLYYVAPNVRLPGFRWITPGGTVAVLLWIAASAAFGIYVANFGSYDATYGALGGVIIFLVWLWISNLAILFGATLNAEVERGREIESGVPMEETIALPPREAAERG